MQFKALATYAARHSY